MQQWIRFALIGGIALCTYLLLLEWDAAQSDFAVQPEPVQPAGEVPAAQQPEAPAAPSSSGLTPRPEAIPEPATASGLVASPQGTATPGRRPTLKLTSDLVQLEVARDSGDLESLALLRYPERLETPGQLIRLFERTGPAHYFARTGLQYPDGRPLPLRFEVGSDAEPDALTLTATAASGLVVERHYSLQPDGYLVRIRETLRNTGADPVVLVPFAAFYRNDVRTEDSPGFGIASYLGAAWGNSDDHYIKVDFDDMREQPVSERSVGGWVAMVQHYFVAAWIPHPDEVHHYQMARLDERNLYVAGLTSPALELLPGDEKSHGIDLYAGPKHQDVLEELAEGLDLTVDYGWLWWLGQPLFSILQLFHQLAGNWGWAIVLLTVLIKLLIYPLSAAGFRSMARMRQLQPDLERLRERYGADRRKMAEQTMELYRKKGVNPLGGCLPLLLPMPVFLALYWVLLESVELRQAPWLLWIQDLAARDPYFVLPLLMGLSMFGSQLLSPPPATMDPVQRRMLQFMPLIFTVFFLWFPSGLVLYWLCNSLLSLLQQWWITRTLARSP